MIGRVYIRAPQNAAFSRERETMTRGEGKKREMLVAHGTAADPSRRPSEMRRYAWEFMAFDDQEVGVPAPHNSAHVCLRSLVDRDRTGRIRVSSQVRSDEDVGLTHRELQRGKIQMRPCKPAVITNRRHVCAPRSCGRREGA